jgi:nucleoside diphosphate kinase
MSTRAVQRTLAIIKPDAVAKGVAGKIIDRIEQVGLTILAARLRKGRPASTSSTRTGRSTRVSARS